MLDKDLELIVGVCCTGKTFCYILKCMVGPQWSKASNARDAIGMDAGIATAGQRRPGLVDVLAMLIK